MGGAGVAAASGGNPEPAAVDEGAAASEALEQGGMP